jgi:hypothetical protein
MVDAIAEDDTRRGACRPCRRRCGGSAGAAASRCSALLLLVLSLAAPQARAQEAAPAGAAAPAALVERSSPPAAVTAPPGEPPAMALPAGADLPESGPPAEPGRVAELASRFHLNGYLTQAYGRSDGNQILGIPKAGTADYRTAAVQLRVDTEQEGSFWIQLGNDRLGSSPAQRFFPEVGIDWLFYLHRFGNLAVKVGRVKIPFGIYNEVRDVGTLLPFYRPSSDFYGTGSFTAETVDGAELSYDALDLGGGWQLDADLFAGNWEFLAITAEEGLVQSKARGSVGGELWLTTPVRGLRLGAGGMRYTAETPGLPNAGSHTEHASLEWEAGRAAAHVEVKRRVSADARETAGYAHLGLRVAPRVSVNVQAEVSNLHIEEVASTIHVDRDLAAGVNYTFRDNLVLKLEHHWNRGYRVDALPDFSAPPGKTRYLLASLSTSF